MQNNDVKYYYITIVFSVNQIKQLRILFDSIKTFSTYKLIVYFISIDDNDSRLTYFKNNERVITKHLNNKLFLPSTYKPYVIIDAIKKNNIYSGLFINVSNIITKYCDDIFSITENIKEFPLSPLHESDIKSIPKYYMQNIGMSTEITQHYVKSSCILFKFSNLSFIKEWYINCLKSTFMSWDEICLNYTYWKHNCVDNYLPNINPNYESFYKNKDNTNEIYLYDSFTDYEIQKKLLTDLKDYYKKNDIL